MRFVDHSCSHRAAFVISTVLALVVASGCNESADDLLGGRRPGSQGGTPDAGATTAAALCAADVGVSYRGFGGTDLVAGRKDAPSSDDRGRLKPFGALRGELARVLGATPAGIGNAGATFEDAPARWYREPSAGAVSLYTAYAVAFEGCLAYTATDPRYAVAPTAASAATECAAMGRRMWSRAPDAEEIAACVEAASASEASEPDPRRRWAYTCAAVLSSAGFLTY